jgi:hypothetical protein
MSRATSNIGGGIALLMACGALGQSSGNVGSDLPPHLRALLIQEMMAISNASQSILDALARGEHERVAERAQAIHDSFIMAREMTPEDRDTLHASVPHDFLERDEALHHLAANLADAARSRNHPDQLELFSEMLEACAGCHAVHAPERFPGLLSGERR